MKKRLVKKTHKIKAVIFDMNGVLALGVELKHGTSLSKSFHACVSKELGIEIDSWFDSIDPVYSDSIKGKVSEDKTINTISKNLEMSRPKLEKAIIKTYKKVFRENKELYSYAFQLKKRGFKIGILSDQWPFSKKAIYDNRKIGKFNVVITSCDVGMRKPNKKIYALTLRKLKVNANESIFIDNRDWNTKPAEKLGMKAILFKNNKQTIREIENLLRR